MKNIIIALTIILSLHITTLAQITKVAIQASGLTCSMCSNSIQKALKALPNTADVATDLNTNTFTITFKNQQIVSIDELKNAIEKSGFTVAKLLATMQFTNIAVKNDEHITANSAMYHFVHIQPQTLNGLHTVQLIDKGFTNAKEYKKNSSYTTMPCIKTGYMQSCCSKNAVAYGTRVYHVTM